MKFGVLLFLVAACYRRALGLSGGAPPNACEQLAQQHSRVTPVDCGSPCPFTVRVVAIDGTPTTLANQNMYRCGSQHTSKFQVHTSVYSSCNQHHGVWIEIITTKMWMICKYYATFSLCT